MSLGENIYRLRTDKGMSQSDLAEALNVSRQSISKWETDASVPELDKLLSLSELFDISLDELVKGEKPQESQPAPEPEQPRSGLYSLILSDAIYDRESAFRFLQKSLGYSEEKAWDLIIHAPSVICSGKYFYAVKHFAEALDGIAETKILSDEDAADPDKVLRAPGVSEPSPTYATPTEEKDGGLDFGGMVVAVVVGVVIAILLLSIF